MDVVGHAQLETRMPARAIEDQHDLFVGTRAHLAGEFGQLDLKERDADGGREMEDGPPRGGMDEADEIAPFKAVLHARHRPLANRRPDPAQQRFEADPVLIDRPQLDAGVRERRGHLAQDGS